MTKLAKIMLITNKQFMKNIALLATLILLLFSNLAMAQTAKGDCTSIEVTNIPSYPTVYTTAGFKNCRDNGGYYAGCDENGRPACCRIYTTGGSTTPRFWLEQLQSNGSWLEVEGPQFDNNFNNVEKGTYRVKCQVPTIAENICTNANGNFNKSRVCVFNTLGQFIGYWGTWDNTPYSTTQPTYSNTVIVGATTESDISYTFIDLPETGSEGAYDFGETVIMDVSDSKNYDLWWVAIFEEGQTFSRYRSNGWQTGTVPNDEFNLTPFWEGNDGRRFETFHSYTVQFVTENSKCRNGIENPNPNGWNNLDRSFFICPAGSGCRFGIDQREIVISPNPANGMIWLQNFNPDLDRDYILTVTDITGRLVKNMPLTSDRISISDLQSGIFVVNILREGESVFNSKLIVNQ